MSTNDETPVNPGDLVYLDTFRGGLVPAKYVGVADYRAVFDTRMGAQVRITADRPGYKRGEYVVWPASQTLPRTHVRLKRTGHVVTGLFRGWVFMVKSGGTLVRGLSSNDNGR